MSTLHRTLWRALAAAFAALLMLGFGTARAFAADTVESYVVVGSINQDGSLSVKATITFDGSAPASLVQRIATSMDAPGDLRYRYDISQIAATSGGQPVTVEQGRDGEHLVLTLATQGLTQPVELTYLVKGAAIKEQTGETTVSWRMLQGLNLPVKQFTAEVSVPTMIALVDCQAGPPATPGACTFYGGGTHDTPNPFFSDGPRGAGEIVTIVVRFPAGTVASNENVTTLWTVGRAFSSTPATLGSALGLLALGAGLLWLLHRRFGVDSSGAAEPTRVAEFRPTGEGQVEFVVTDTVRPGQVGTVMDERVDPIDVTATLLDLAVRGHVRIQELPRDGAHALTEWQFIRRSGGDDLAAYEATLLDAVAPGQGEPLRVADLGVAIGGVIGQIQGQLYDEVVARGWFAHRPDQTRSTWARLGWAALAGAVIVTALLAAFTTFGLVGLALILLALGLLWVSQEMPARTASGSSLLAGLNLLRAQLAGQPTDQMPKGRELQELSEILPYAVVLGGADRWLQAVAEADTDADPDNTDLDWYHAPEGWHLADLPVSVKNFITTVQGTLFSR